MRELTEAIDKAAHDGTGASFDEMRNAACRWADHALRTYDGDLLNRAWAISASMSNFCNGLERPDVLE